ncbi:response regulator transcription factor [Acidovorax sp. FJL06]|uniref:response regulator transcription factor n=1 Tax=Acidovorax sp. FJL06 TaxID=2153365 RepID=UPI000F589296|nr:response regulator transcription factor [Acidovorax sp. FJL06]RQO79576.1 DNA-binding response regulator [Acidovorax sp. FJL06]
MRHFLASDAAQPSDRWWTAFPQGACFGKAGRPALVEALQKADGAPATAWLSTEYSDWPELLRTVLAQAPAARVVVVSCVPDDREGLRAINEGARAYCHLFAIPEMLQEVALVVQHGGLWVGPTLVARLAAATWSLGALQASPQGQEGLLQLLSSRELEVAQAVARGLSNKEIAEKLFISERTVKAHLGATFEKLHVRDRVQLVLRLNQGANGHA